MSTGSQKRTRSERVASLALPPGRWARGWFYVKQGEVLTRIGLCVLAALATWLITGAWSPPFPYRTGQIPSRDITARVEFSREDENATRMLREQKRRESKAVYENRSQPLIQLQAALRDKVFLLIGDKSYDELEEETKSIWREFLPEALKAEMADESVAFEDFREALARDPQLESFQGAVKTALDPWEDNGLLQNLHDPEKGNQLSILVHPYEQPDLTRPVAVKEVRINEIDGELQSRLQREFRKLDTQAQHADLAAKLVFHWLKPRLTPTLTYNETASRRVADEEAARVEPATVTTYRGNPIAAAGNPLTVTDLARLRLEHQAMLSQMTVWQMLARGWANFGMYVAMYVLCGGYVWFNERRLLVETRRLGTMLAVVVGTVALACFAADDRWRGELMPLAIFGMTVAVAYRREVALVLSAAVALVITVSLGQGLAEFVVLVSGVTGSALLLGRIRNRTKLIYIGGAAGVVAALTTIGVGVVLGQPFGPVQMDAASVATDAAALGDAAGPMQVVSSLMSAAVRNGLCMIVAGIVMTGLLPFVERTFDVQTDLSLLELGDAAHPLLQELARRAPGTYNHSINVASLGESAAEAIGANGLLVRVGAYFHDIGKMFKPEYFVENQSQQKNQHESLLPAMSTLVIIAHVKDGADLARQHRLPQSIIDFIEQHHGTTLVEYFYRQAEKRSAEDPDHDTVDESSFRYPGPKPQRKETAVIMLADAVESACRALVDPAPSRIEGLVHDIAMRRLMDGQFDQCGLTLQELHIIESSLIKSLIAVYHGRVKYPGQMGQPTHAASSERQPAPQTQATA